MKKAIKKAALGLTIALTMSTAIACAPAADRGAMDERGFRGTGVHQDRGTQFGTRQPGLLGDRQPGALGNDTRGGLFGNRMGTNQTRERIGVTGGDTLNRGTIQAPRGGTLFGGAGPRMHGARTNMGDTNRGVGFGMQGAGGMNRGVGLGTPGAGGMNRGAGLGMQGAGGMNQGAGFGMQGAGGMNQGAGFGMQGAGGMNRGTGLGTPTDLGARARAGVNNALDAGPYDQNRADDMRRRVMSINGVRDAKVVFHNNAVIVGVDAEGNTNNLVRQVRQQLQGHTRGEQVHVTTDRGMVTRIGDIDNRVRTGQPIRNMANEIGTLMNDLGRTMTAPIRGGAAGTGTRGAGNTGGGVFGTGATR